MEFSTQTIAPEKIPTGALAVGVFQQGQLSAAAQAINEATAGALAAIVQQEFSGTHGSTLTLYHLNGIGAQRVILVGLGKPEELTARRFAGAVQAAARALAGSKASDAAVALAEVEVKGTSLRQRCQQIAMACVQATYRYDATFSKRDEDNRPTLAKVTVLASEQAREDAEQGLRQGAAIGRGMVLARHLGNLPANVCTPTYLADKATELGKTHGFKVEVLERKQLEALKMGAFLAVAKGSEEPPRFIVMQYQGTKGGKRGKSTAKGAPVVLVGKGITFDSGGISLKPAATMDEMKFDMCGAASVLGTMQAVAELQLPIDVVGIVAACENLPSGRANKPGDVITSMSGQTIEVLNTDAEGRLILCDALTYAERFKPSAVIDIATLTGACVVALGHVNTGLFTADDGLAQQLLQASAEAVDPAWRMPLDDEYQEQLKSNFADIANIGGQPAGSVTAACFLSRFTRAYPWAHLDIAGTAWKSGKEKNATGRPVPLLVQFLINRQAHQQA